jgi:hypothetical protein
MEPKGAHKSLPQVPVLSQINAVYTITSNLDPI